MTKQSSVNADLPEGVNLPLKSLIDLQKLELQLKDEACYSAIVHLVLLNIWFYRSCFFVLYFFTTVSLYIHLCVTALI